MSTINSGHHQHTPSPVRKLRPDGYIYTPQQNAGTGPVAVQFRPFESNDALKGMDNGQRTSDGFRRDAVPVALTGGLTRRQVPALNKWIKSFDDRLTGEHWFPLRTRNFSFARENGRLRRENRALKEERDVLKKPQPSSRGKRREVRIYRSVSDNAMAGTFFNTLKAEPVRRQPWHTGR